MSVSFDPYYKWLGIKPEDQPPNHYRLLGINLFEHDPDVIANAVDRQMTHVRSHQLGPHMELSQKLLNEIAAAKVCLLDPERKAEYDAQLEHWYHCPPAPPPPILPLRQTSEDTSAPPVLEESFKSPEPIAEHSKSAGWHLAKPTTIWWLVSGSMMAAVVLLCGVLALATLPGGTPRKTNDKGPTTSPTSPDSPGPSSGPNVPATNRIRLIDTTNAPEAEGILDTILTRYPSVLDGVTQIELAKYHDATELKRNAGAPAPLPGSQSGTPIAGRHDFIMLWGIYEEWPPGKYLVVYRVQALSEIAGENVCFLDVCRGGVTIAQNRPSHAEFKKGEWSNLPITLSLKARTVIEYRLWPQNHVIALDRLYVFRIP